MMGDNIAIFDLLNLFTYNSEEWNTIKNTLIDVMDRNTEVIKDAIDSIDPELAVIFLLHHFGYDSMQIGSIMSCYSSTSMSVVRNNLICGTGYEKIWLMFSPKNKTIGEYKANLKTCVQWRYVSPVGVSIVMTRVHLLNSINYMMQASYGSIEEGLDDFFEYIGMDRVNDINSKTVSVNDMLIGKYSINNGQIELNYGTKIVTNDCIERIGIGLDTVVHVDTIPLTVDEYISREEGVVDVSNYFEEEVTSDRVFKEQLGSIAKVPVLGYTFVSEIVKYVDDIRPLVLVNKEWCINVKHEAIRRLSNCDIKYSTEFVDPNMTRWLTETNKVDKILNTPKDYVRVIYATEGSEKGYNGEYVSMYIGTKYYNVTVFNEEVMDVLSITDHREYLLVPSTFNILPLSLGFSVLGCPVDLFTQSAVFIKQGIQKVLTPMGVLDILELNNDQVRCYAHQYKNNVMVQICNKFEEEKYG